MAAKGVFANVDAGSGHMAHRTMGYGHALCQTNAHTGGLQILLPQILKQAVVYLNLLWIEVCFCALFLGRFQRRFMLIARPTGGAIGTAFVPANQNAVAQRVRKYTVLYGDFLRVFLNLHGGIAKVCKSAVQKRNEAAVFNLHTGRRVKGPVTAQIPLPFALKHAVVTLREAKILKGDVRTAVFDF